MSEPEVNFRDEPPSYSPPALEDKPPVKDEPPAAPSTGLTTDEKNWGMYCHLSSLAGYVIPAGNVIGPIVCWQMKKDTSAFVDRHGKESVNFQLNLLIVMTILVVVGFITLGLGWLLMFPVGIYGIVMSVLAGLKANNGEEYQYP